MVAAAAHLSCSIVLFPIGPRRHPRPLLESPVKRRRFGKTQLLGDLLQRQVRAAQMVDGDIPPQVVLELLEAGAFLAQVPTQCLGADVQMSGYGVQVRPASGVAAEQATQLAAQAVSVVRARQQVGRGTFEKAFESPFILEQRHVQVAAVERQAAMRCVEHHGTREQQIVLGSMGRPGVAESGLFQADPLADQPTAKAVPDHQQALGEEVVRVPKGRVVQHQAHPFTFRQQGQARRIREQAVEQQAALQGAAQVTAVDQRMTHHGEGPGLAASLAETQVFIAHRQPQRLQQASELLWREARPRLVQKLGTDTQLLQQGEIVEPLSARAPQGGAGEMAGDRALAHGIHPFVRRSMVAGRSGSTRRISAKSRNVSWPVGGNPPP